MSRLTSAIRSYVSVTCAYGLAHTIPEVWSKKTKLYNKLLSDPTEKEMLTVDKVVMCVLRTATAPLTWPWMLRRDLVHLECLVRGKPSWEYLPSGDDL